MADPPHYPHTGEHTGRYPHTGEHTDARTEEGSTPGTMSWVWKGVLIVVVVLILVAIILGHVVGGFHGPHG